MTESQSNKLFWIKIVLNMLFIAGIAIGAIWLNTEFDKTCNSSGVTVTETSVFSCEVKNDCGQTQTLYFVDSCKLVPGQRIWLTYSTTPPTK